jgi:hypothetical protein
MPRPRPADEVVADALRLFESLEFRQALDLIDQEGAPHAADEPLLPFMQACAHARLDDPSAAVDSLAGSGHWYSAELIDHTRSLDTVRASGVLDELIESFERRRRAETGAADSVLVSGGTSQPLLVALHGNWDNPQRARAVWRAALPPDWTVAAIASPAAIAPARYAWYGGTAVAEVTDALERLRNRRPIVLAGISSGADTAIDVLLSGADVAGVIATAVGEGPAAFTDGANRSGKIYFIAGSSERLGERTAALADAGVRSIVETVPGLGHAYPDDLADVAQRALAFLVR